MPGVEAREPAVALNPERGALITWSEITSDGSGPVFNYATAPVGAAFTVGSPSVAAPDEERTGLQDAWLPDGSALMSWHTEGNLFAAHWTPAGGSLPAPGVVIHVGHESTETLLTAGGSGAPVLAWIGDSPLDSSSEAVRYTFATGLVGPAPTESEPMLALTGSRDLVRTHGIAIKVRCAERCALTASARIFALKTDNAEEAGGNAYHKISAFLTLHRTLRAKKTEVSKIRSTQQLLQTYCRSVHRHDDDAVEIRVSVRGLATDAEHAVVLGETPNGQSCPR